METIQRLRAPDGCPWDIEQTPFTMRDAILEEAYETIDAITNIDTGTHYESGSCTQTNAEACEELGDLLFNVLMVAYMFEQSGSFSVADVLDGVTQKIIRRHPHVFGKTEGFAGPTDKDKAKSPKAVLEQWDSIKKEVEHRHTNSVLDSIPKSFSSLMRAHKMQKKVSKVGFDFKSVEDAIKKAEEELDELKQQQALLQDYLNTADKNSNSTLVETYKKSLETEMGDVLFSLVNVARLLGIQSELALQTSNEKFEKRFHAVEHAMQEEGIPLEPCNVDKMNNFWEKAKKEEQ